MELNEVRRERIIEIISNEYNCRYCNIEELKNYIKNNSIILKDLNNKYFDILTNVINEFGQSQFKDDNYCVEVVKFILKQCKYETLNYTFGSNYENNGEVPLFNAIAKKKFKVANLLLKYGADINYRMNKNSNENMNILSSICYKKYYEDDYINKTYFDKDIIRFILNNGFRQNEIDSHLINSLVILNNNKDNELEYIFKHFTYNNSMILKLVFINKNKKSISNLELDSLIVQLKKVVVIEESVYKFLISRGKYHTINTLFIYDKSTKDIMLNKIFKFNLINIALQHNEKNFLKNILNYESLDIQSIGFESIIINGIHNYYNSKILKFFTELLKQKHYNFEIVNFENILLEINKNFKEIDINFIKVLIELTMKINNFELIKLLMEHKELKYVDIINTKDKNDEYPIIVAYYSSKYYAKKSPYKCYQIFEYLLKQGAKINAIQKNNIDTVKEYIKKQNFTNSICNFNFNILTFSYLTNKKNIFNFLINENEKMFQISDSNNFYLLQYAILKEDIDMIYQIIKLNNENCIKYIKYLLDMSIEIG
eukprot:jgi/Orpsp1_1/1190448/evm.model.d7180000079029.1